VRILLVSEFYPPILGGLELHVQALARSLVARDHDVHVATLAPDARTCGDGVEVHVLSSTLGGLVAFDDRSRPYHPPVADPRVSRGLRRLLADLRPDVVHAHNCMATSLPARPHRPPLVYTAHDYSLVCSKRSLLGPANGICEGPALARCLPCSARHYGPGRGALMALAGTRTARAVDADAYIAVSDFVADVIGPVAGPVRTIPTFVPDEALGFDGAVDGLPAGPFVMFGGAAEHHKGLDLLLDLWRDPPGMPAPLVVAVAKGTLNPPPGVVVLRLTWEQTIVAWRRAAVAAVPSLCADACPTVAIEAMLGGTPVVASAVGGLPSLVVDGRTGLCVPAGDAHRLRDAIVGLLGDEPRRDAMGRNGRRWAQQFLASNVVPRVEALYDELLGRPRLVAHAALGRP